MSHKQGSTSKIKKLKNKNTNHRRERDKNTMHVFLAMSESLLTWFFSTKYQNKK